METKRSNPSLQAPPTTQYGRYKSIRHGDSGDKWLRQHQQQSDAKREAEANAKLEAERKARLEAAQKVRYQAEEKTKREAEEKRKAEEKAKHERRHRWRRSVRQMRG